MIKRCKVSIVLLLVLSFSNTVFLFGEVIKEWDVFEIQFTAKKAYEVPYLQSISVQGLDLLKVIFTAMDGPMKGEKIVVPGFWDGGSSWKVRFTAPEEGIWVYRSESSDSGMDNINGTVTVAALTEEEKRENPVRRGLIRVHATGERAGRYFEYSDGTPFLWIGDTWWSFAKRGVHFDSFKEVVDDRAERGFTVGQIFIAGWGWNSDWSTPIDMSILNETCTEPDIELLKKLDKFVSYANSKGITVWITGWWGGRNLMERGEYKISTSDLQRWWKYLIARYGAYNVIWILCGEYNMDNYGGEAVGKEFWNDLGEMVDSYDPYERIISVHPTPPGWFAAADAPMWSTGEVIHNQPWLSYNQIQTGHDEWRNGITPYIVIDDYRRTPIKPVVVTESWYEFISGNAPAHQIRFAGWSAILSGAAGSSYGAGGIWKAHVPEAPVTPPDKWPMELSSIAINYPGGSQIGYMAKFLKRLPWWKLEPNSDIVTGAADLYCSAIPGELYIIYSRWGGEIKVKLDIFPQSAEFDYYWFNPRTGKNESSGKIDGGEIGTLKTPDVNDWVLCIQRI